MINLLDACFFQTAFSFWIYKILLSLLFVSVLISTISFLLSLGLFCCSFFNFLERVFSSFNFQPSLFCNIKIVNCIPGWCGSVDCLLSCEPESCRFDSQSKAHAWVAGQVPSRGCVRGNHALMFLSLCFSFLSALYKNK